MAKLKTQFNDLVSVPQREKVSILFLEAPWIYDEPSQTYTWTLGEEYNGKEIIVSSINDDSGDQYQFIIPSHFKNTKVLFYNFNQTPSGDHTFLRLKKLYDTTNPKGFLTTFISNPNYANNLDGYGIAYDYCEISILNMGYGWAGIEVKEETHIVELTLAVYGDM